ncbi:MAG: hypothetical protein ACFFBD_06930, partial [Candidatus Hodarchaeota archaeon]
NILTRNWQASLRIYTIMSKNKNLYPSGFGRQELLELLEKNNIILKHKNSLARYLRPLKKTAIISTYNKGRSIFYVLRKK